MKHTQGEWRTTKYGQIISKEDNAQIAVVHQLGRFEDEIIANAKLIAAAPELLTATHNALQSLLAVNELNNGLIPDSTLKELQTAINKATL